MELSVENLYALLIRSRLLSPSDAKAMFARWQSEAGKAENDTARFGQWMVAKGYITEYQASLLARGHTEGFFLDQYKIIDRLGRGRMAGVYRGVHQLGQEVAIKVLPPSKAKDPHLLGRFLRESRLAVGLNHEHIVRTFQVGDAHGVHYLVMEHLEGEPFDETLKRRGKLPPQEAVRIIHQALKGLQYLHEKGLVHRDLKPGNLMLLPPAGKKPKTTLDCWVKIVDIGLVRAGLEGPNEDLAPQLTTEGTLLGTPDYMSPEQGRDARSVDIRSDIYSLGCVLYHALAGQPPFPDANIISQMIRHSSEVARPLKEFNPEVPDGLQQIVNWMMAKNPAERYPTPDRAASALEVFLAVGADIDPGLSDPHLQRYLNWLDNPTNTGNPHPQSEDQAEENLAPSIEKAKVERSHDSKVSKLPVPSPSPSMVGRSPDKQSTLASSRSMPESPSVKLAVKTAEPAKKDQNPQLVPAALPPKSVEQVMPPPLPEPNVTTPGSPEFDVELVVSPLSKKKSIAPGDGSRILSRRDLVMFGLGALTIVLALGIGKLLALAFPKKRPTPPEPAAESVEGTEPDK